MRSPQSEEILNNKLKDLLRENMITLIKIVGADQYFYEGKDPAELHGIYNIFMGQINDFFEYHRRQNSHAVTGQLLTAMTLLHFLMASRLIYEASNKTISTASFFEIAKQITHENRNPALPHSKL